MTEHENLIECRNVQKWFETRGEGLLSTLLGRTQPLKAVDGVSFDIRRGEILGLAGQSGCGKSTLGELILRLLEPTGGAINFEGDNMVEFDKEQMKEFRRRCQVVFQDPYEALNPRWPAGRLVSEPLTIHGIGNREERDAKTMEALEDAGLRPPGKYLNNLPTELSGGERQRVCIARAMVLDPDFLVADEPVSMLDVSVRTSILHLFERLQADRDLTMLYISHDLSTIDYLADRTMIMYLGNNVEIGPTEQVINEPAHPYTETLVDAVPTPDPKTRRSGSRLSADIPDPVNLPDGCRFNPECPYATDECFEVEPELEEAIDGDRYAACYHPVNRQGSEQAADEGEQAAD